MEGIVNNLLIVGLVLGSIGVVVAIAMRSNIDLGATMRGVRKHYPDVIGGVENGIKMVMVTVIGFLTLLVLYAAVQMVIVENKRVYDAIVHTVLPDETYAGIASFALVISLVIIKMNISYTQYNLGIYVFDDEIKIPLKTWTLRHLMNNFKVFIGYQKGIEEKFKRAKPVSPTKDLEDLLSKIVVIVMFLAATEQMLVLFSSQEGVPAIQGLTNIINTSDVGTWWNLFANLGVTYVFAMGEIALVGFATDLGLRAWAGANEVSQKIKFEDEQEASGVFIVDVSAEQSRAISKWQELPNILPEDRVDLTTANVYLSKEGKWLYEEQKVRTPSQVRIKLIKYLETREV